MSAHAYRAPEPACGCRLGEPACEAGLHVWREWFAVDGERIALETRAHVLPAVRQSVVRRWLDARAAWDIHLGGLSR
jgi:hypothetical protein